MSCLLFKNLWVKDLALRPGVRLRQPRQRARAHVVTRLAAAGTRVHARARPSHALCPVLRVCVQPAHAARYRGLRDASARAHVASASPTRLVVRSHHAPVIRAAFLSGADLLLVLCGKRPRRFAAAGRRRLPPQPLALGNHPQSVVLRTDGCSGRARLRPCAHSRGKRARHTVKHNGRNVGVRLAPLCSPVGRCSVAL